jgi:NADPH2:quinone reductase
MNAIVVRQFGGPEVLQLEAIRASTPGPGQVLVKLHAVGVNPVDTYIRSGTYARTPTLPYTPGTDGAGIVERVGEGVTRLGVGQRVYVAATLDPSFEGSYRQMAVCGQDFVQPLADRLSFAQGAGIGVPCSTAYRAVFHKAGLRPGETVLVHGGSGGVGLAAIQMSRAWGATVIASAGTPDGLNLVRANGAHHAVDHTREGYRDEVLALTGGRGVDAIIEMLANVNLGHDLGLLAMRGRVVVVGSRGDVQITPRQTMAKDSAVMGLALWNTTLDEMRIVHAALVAGAESGWLTPVVGREWPLAQAADAHVAVMRAGAHGKLVLLP